MVVEPLPALAVGEKTVARSTLGRALERGLVKETWENMTKTILSCDILNTFN